MHDLAVDVATVNDNYNSPGSNIEEVLQQHADIVGIQEGKATDYRRRLSYRYGVHQDTSTEARAGSAIVWDRGINLNAQRRGWTFGVHAPGLLARFLAWVIFRPTGVHPFVVIAAHWPPQRVRGWWHPYELALSARVRYFRARGFLVIVPSDSNQHRHRARFAGLVWHSASATSIDGFWTSPRIRVQSVRFLPFGTSDHKPQVARMVIPGSHR